ncbi:MAG: Dihydroorotate dehydrogenase B (NAD(+)), electron transfer subunit [Holosporales bacterium]
MNFFLNKNKSISFLGDMNPHFSGSVVRALKSAKDGSKEIIAHIKKTPPKGCCTHLLNRHLTATLIDRIRLTDSIDELIIHAPLHVKNFKPSQFFRIQNFERVARLKNTKILPILEPLALTGAFVNREKSTISLIVLNSGLSSSLTQTLKIGEEITLLGPTGEPTEIVQNKHVLLVGGGVGNAVLFSIADALQKNGCKVYYLAAYKTKASRFKIKEIEASSNIVYWVCEDGVLEKNRETDFSYKGTVLDALEKIKDSLKQIDHIICIGSDGMMKAVAKARYFDFKDYFLKDPKLIGSINSPMQCMMKGICGQCVQVHKCDTTGQETVIFSCKNQDQDLKTIDFNCLNNRLKQNSLQEKIINFKNHL